MTDTISVGPGAVATQVVSEGDGETLVINTGPATVFFGDHNSIRALDGSGVVPVTPNSYFAVTGEKDLFACVLTGQNAFLNIISGGLNFFLPLSSLTIPYGATGQRIVINPPDYPGSIVGYNPSGLVEFVISPNGYLLYDATGGALNHLFIAIQNAAGSDLFANPFVKGIQIGPQTGPQVLISGGNPAIVSFPLNSTGFLASGLINGLVIPTGGTKFGQVAVFGPQATLAGHRDQVAIAFNSANVDGSSAANTIFAYADATTAQNIMAFYDNNGFGIPLCQQITSTDPSHVNTVSSPAIAEIWHDLRPLQNSFIGTVAGAAPPQLRKCADGDVQIYGNVRTPPTTGSYSGIPWTTIPINYRPNHLVRAFVANAPIIGAPSPDPVISVNTNGNVAFTFLPTSLAQTDIFVNVRYPLDSTGILQT